MSDLLDLRIFVRVVQAGSLSAAARELQISPALVSKRLARMEERLGSRLMQRTTRRLTLTETGEGYYERIRVALQGIDEAEAFTSSSGQPRGLLRISMPTAYGRMHVAPRLKRFLDVYPAVSLEIDLNDALVDVIGDGFDLAIRIGALEDTSMVARKVAPNKRIFCATPGYLAAHGEPHQLCDLKMHQLLASSNQSEWRLQGPAGPCTYRPSSLIVTNSSELIREAVVSGIGIGFRSTWDIAAALQDGRLCRVLPEYAGAANMGIWALYPSRRLVAPKVQAFVDFLVEQVGPEPNLAPANT